MTAAFDDAFIGEVTFFVDHGLIMIEDPESAYLHDEWDPVAEYVSAGPDSLYLSVRPSVDGPVTIVIAKAEIADSPAKVVYFDGAIETGSRNIVVHDANDVARFALTRPNGPNRLKVFVDQAGLASHLLVVFL